MSRAGKTLRSLAGGPMDRGQIGLSVHSSIVEYTGSRQLSSLREPHLWGTSRR
jgi:hypothetical protein